MKYVSPLLYAAGFVPAIMVVWQIMMFVEYNVGFGYDRGLGLDDFTTLYFNGDVAGVLAVVLVGSVVFGALTQVLTWVERLPMPGALDHLRYCALLYVFLGFLATVLIAAFPNNGDVAGGYALVALGFVIVGYAIFINAVLISLRRRRHSQANQTRSWSRA